MFFFFFARSEHAWTFGSVRLYLWQWHPILIEKNMSTYFGNYIDYQLWFVVMENGVVATNNFDSIWQGVRFFQPWFLCFAEMLNNNFAIVSCHWWASKCIDWKSICRIKKFKINLVHSQGIQKTFRFSRHFYHNFLLNSQQQILLGTLGCLFCRNSVNEFSKLAAINRRWLINSVPS